MKNNFLSLLLSLLAITFSGCICGSEEDAVAAAREQILKNKAGCLIIKNGRIIRQANGRGIAPILDLYRQHSGDMQNAILVDKVIGKAAAMVAVCGKVRRVHAELICDSAVELLKKHDIQVSWTLKVENILNRRRDGLCPMESAVLNVSDPQTGLIVLEKAVAAMRNGR